MSIIVGVVVVGLIAWLSMDSGNEGEVAAIRMGLDELKSMTGWLRKNTASAAAQMRLFEQLDNSGYFFMMQTRNLNLGSVTGTSRRVEFDLGGLMIAQESLKNTKGGPADAMAYLSGLRMAVLTFYVSAPTYTILSEHYREFARIMSEYVRQAPQLVDHGLRVTLSRIAEDLHEVALHEIARPLDEALKTLPA